MLLATLSTDDTEPVETDEVLTVEVWVLSVEVDETVCEETELSVEEELLTIIVGSDAGSFSIRVLWHPEISPTEQSKDAESKIDVVFCVILFILFSLCIL